VDPRSKTGAKQIETLKNGSKWRVYRPAIQRAEVHHLQNDLHLVVDKKAKAKSKLEQESMVKKGKFYREGLYCN
jgi:hypothetical protein